MISVLCGLFEATSGRAEVYGMELREHIADIHMLTGTLWPFFEFNFFNTSQQQEYARNMTFFGRA